MAYILYRRDEERDLTLNRGLGACLRLAMRFGWDPMGTVDPFDNPEVGLWDSETCGEWPGDYCAHCCQTVREDDARAFSSALFQGLDMISGEKLTPEELEAVKEDFPDFNEEPFLAMVREVAEFAAEGAFQIC